MIWDFMSVVLLTELTVVICPDCISRLSSRYIHFIVNILFLIYPERSIHITVSTLTFEFGYLHVYSYLQTEGGGPLPRLNVTMWKLGIEF